MDFTQAQQNMLKNKFSQFKMAELQLQEFTQYLAEEYKIPKDENREIKADLTGFMDKVEKNSKIK